MSAEDIICCLNCHMTFSSHEEHTCIEMKKARIEAPEFISNKENESDNIPKMKKRKKDIVKKKGIFQVENSENFTVEARNKRESPKSPESDIIDVETIKYQDEEQVSDNSNLERFIATIIQQVDELCENIKTGDPDTKRSEDVNLKLKSAVDCYRSKFNTEKEIFVEIETVENYDEKGQGTLKIRRPWTDDEFNSTDFLHDSKVPEKQAKESKGPEEKKKEESKLGAIHNENIKRAFGLSQNIGVAEPRKKINDVNFELVKNQLKGTSEKVPCKYCDKEISKKNIRAHVRKHTGEAKYERKKINDEKFELVKNQCGRHEIYLMALMLNINSSRLRLRIKKEGITFSEKLEECLFCEKNRNASDIKYDDFLPFLKFNSNENKFECSICNSSYIERNAMYTHIRTKHENEIVLKVLPNSKPKNHKQCNGSVCKRVYGSKNMGKKMWCEECLRELKLAEEMKKESKAELPCAECGKLFTSLKMLNAHKKAVHEKVPCSECGKLFGVTNIKGHMKSTHTPDDQKKFRCDTCGKGFINKQHFSEHLNIHTGEKPFKCKFCPAAFASKNSCAKHERLGFCVLKREKHICNVCSWEFSTLNKLNKHKKAVHEKVPCADCGKLFGPGPMNKHTQSVHTPDDQKKFRCDTCDKGFISNQCLLEHINFHTGEKPFKCTECIKLFVSKKLMNRHIRSAHTPDDQKKFRCDKYMQ